MLKRLVTIIGLGAAALTLFLWIGTGKAEAQSDQIGYEGAFSIKNDTGITLYYYVRWGDDGVWKLKRLDSGQALRHRHTLDWKNQAPSPSVKFDRIGGDNRTSLQIQKMGFYKVVAPGFDPMNRNTKSKRYVFRFAANGRDLYLAPM